MAESTSFVSVKKRLLSGGLWAFSFKVGTALVGLVGNAFLARLLAPDALGVYFLTLSLVSIAAVFAQLGLDQTVVRLVAESMGTDRPGRAVYAVRIALRLTAMGSIAVAAILLSGVGGWIASYLFHSAMMARVVGLAALWTIVMVFQRLLAEIFRGFHDIRLASFFEKFLTSLVSALLFTAVWSIQGQAEISEVILIGIVAGASTTLIAGVLLKGRLGSLGVESDPEVRNVLAIAWPLWITSLTFIIITQADLWILGMFRPQDEVAIYGTALRVVGLIAMPISIVNAVVPPLISEMYVNGSRDKLERTLRGIATVSGFPSFLGLLGIVIFSDSILALVFGEFYRTGATVLVILCIGQFANVWAGACGLTMMMTGLQVPIMAISIVSALVTITGAVLLVQPYGSVGVALSSMTALIFQNIMLLTYVKRKRGFWTHMDMSLFVQFLRMRNN